MNFKQTFRWQSLYVIVLMIGWHNINAQSINRSLNDVAMPSANATAFGKYIDIPVSQFTGVPNISVPITTIQEGTLSLPIGLNYHASGIKVGELASWVGLGWNLSFGGQISRTIVGHPDESNSRKVGWLNGGSLLTREAINRDLAVQNSLGAQGTVLETDTEPDIFAFTAGNYSGKFYFDANQSPVLVPKQDVLIIKDSNILNDFTIVTPDGTRYLYGQTDNVSAYELIAGSPGVGDKQVWHLLKIEDYTRKFWIKFTYQEEGHKYPSVASVHQTYSSSYVSPLAVSVEPVPGAPSPAGVRTSWGAISSSATNHLPVDNAMNMAYTNTIRLNASQRLTSITTSSGKTTLIFGATNVREDLDANDATVSPKRLDYIDVKTNAGEIYTKRLEFNYDYLMDANCPAAAYTKRLRLLSVQEKTVAAPIPQMLPPYQFEYEGDNNYPNRLSKAIDHWGFYNAQISNNPKLLNISAPLLPT